MGFCNGQGEWARETRKLVVVKHVTSWAHVDRTEKSRRVQILRKLKDGKWSCIPEKPAIVRAEGRIRDLFRRHVESWASGWGAVDVRVE
jgi:hypothetical protein